jgi:tetratricopeptide (TPR) repeat protein
LQIANRKSLELPVLILRIKQCEHALSDGRLDRAFELVREPALRADRRGQELVVQLARAFVRRGQEHAEAGRIAEASADGEKAAALAGSLPEVAELRAAVADATAKRMDAERIVGNAIAAARRQVDAGQLTVGQNMLAGVEDDGRADALKQDVANKRASLQSAIAKASAAFAAGDWENAVDHLSGLRRQFPSDAELRELSGKIAQNVTIQISRAIETGRLDLAFSLISRLDRLAHPSVELDQIRRTLQECRAAFDLIRETEAQRAMEILRRLAPLWPRAAWLEPAVDRLKQLSESLEELRSGPLGLTAFAPAIRDPHETLPVPPANKEVKAQFPQAPANNASPAGSRFILHVDGVASFAVLTQPVVTLGPASSSAAPDIALMAGANVPTVTISRNDDDYFLQSREPVLINDRPTTGKVLASGDKIALGPRCRVTFRRPSAASSTAVLDLSGARLQRGDVRHVILLDREILIGPGSAAHVRHDELVQTAVLRLDNGKLMLRSAEAIQIDGQPATKPAEIATGAHVRLGPVSFVVTKD